MSRPSLSRLWSRSLCWECSKRASPRPLKRKLAGPGTIQSRCISEATTFSKSSSTPSFYPPPDKVTKASYAHLPDKSLLRLQGPDVVSFLNGLLPSRLQPLSEAVSNPTFTAFLTAKGRLLYDVFIYPPTASRPAGPWYLEVDSRSASSLLSHLKKHKLRSKFKLERVPEEELGVVYVWPGANSKDLDIQLGGQDPRPLMGSRILAAKSDTSGLMVDGEALTTGDYKIHRMIAGHAEGPKELIANSALPQESNLDFYNGIDFHKGCYLGQELTIRTHHTGVVRKRILPCQISSKAIDEGREVPVFDSSADILHPPPESNISKYRSTGRAGRSTGKWLGGVGNIGLSLCRLEMMTDIQLTAEGSTFDPDDQFKIIWEDPQADSDGKTDAHEVVIKPFVPAWLRRSIETNMQARSERSRKKHVIEDEEDEEDR